MTLYVNVYEVWDQYGGPEEGGWWYTVTNPIVSRIQPSKRFAEATRECLREEYPSELSYRRSDNQYMVLVEDHPGEFYPTERPHYE